MIARLLRPRGLAAVGVAALLVAGCTGDGGDPGAEDDQAPDVATDEGDAGEDRGPSGRLQLTGWQEQHPVLVTVALRAVRVDAGGHVLIDVEAANRGIRGGAASIAQRGVLVRDDLGNVYPFVPPDDHDRLRFVADERLTGTLAFLGPVDPEARTLTVAFNQTEDDGELIGASQDNLNQFPRFLFEDVPLPGVGLEDEADRGGSAQPLTTEQQIEVGVSVVPDGNPDLTVTAVAYATDGLTVHLELEAVNRSGVVVALTSGSPVLEDDLGSTYVFQRAESADHDEEVLRLEPGQEVSATLAWRGAIPAEAETLAVRFNSEDFQTESSPFLVIDLPLPDPR